MILIVGSPRSGTTWIGKTFDSHPDTLYRHEPDSTFRSRELPLLIDAERFDEFAGAARSYVTSILAKTDPKTSGRLPVFPKRYYHPAAFQCRRASVFAAKLAGRFGFDVRIPDLVSFRTHPELRLVWKSIESAGRAALIARQFPRCYVIHIVRHPCGHVASTVRGEKLGKFVARESAAEDKNLFDILLKSPPLRSRHITREHLDRLNPAQRLAWRWLAFNELAMTELDKLPNTITVTYESICEQPTEVYKRLFELCGLEWSDQTEEFVRRSTASDDQTYYSVVKNPAQAAAKWRDELAAENVEQIMEIVKDSAPGKLFA